MTYLRIVHVFCVITGLVIFAETMLCLLYRTSWLVRGHALAPKAIGIAIAIGLTLTVVDVLLLVFSTRLLATHVRFIAAIRHLAAGVENVAGAFIASARAGVGPKSRRLAE